MSDMIRTGWDLLYQLAAKKLRYNTKNYITIRYQQQRMSAPEKEGRGTLLPTNCGQTECGKREYCHCESSHFLKLCATKTVFQSKDK